MLPIVQHSFDSWSKLTGGRATLSDTLILLEQPLQEKSVSNNNSRMNFDSEIVFDHITFSYSGSKQNVINDISLKIKKGDRIGLVGETGSGKSTFIDIFMGLLVPQNGEIRVDGVILNKSNAHSWQQNISHVPQSIFLIDATIKENIAFGVDKDKIDIEKVVAASKIAQIHSIVNEMPNQYLSNVGEKAVQISGGQRQRIAIARALYKNLKIIVLDEATSALDTTTENRLMEAIDKVDKDITMLMVAHRLSTLKDCNKIIEFENGKIKRIGSYEEIITSQL